MTSNCSQNGKLGGLVKELDKAQKTRSDSEGYEHVARGMEYRPVGILRYPRCDADYTYHTSPSGCCGPWRFTGVRAGVQRQECGVRTHMLVAIGAALFVLIPQQAGASTADLTRVLQGLIAGVGFLGAGAIILGTKQVETQGLTTAAGIWVTAAIGVAAGMGRESTAVLSTLVALFVLSVVPWIVRDCIKSKK